jgi:hypothetical protein
VSASTPTPAAKRAGGAVLALTLAMRNHALADILSTPAQISRRMRIAEPPPDMRDLVAWAGHGTPRATMFAVPPLDDRFTVLRLAAGRGVFALPSDVDQLIYDAAHYAEAHERLVAQGVSARGPHDFDATPWDTLGPPALAKLRHDGVDYAVFDSARRSPLEFPVVYRDRWWVVYDIRDAR